MVSAAATGDVPRRFADVQEETGQGPCMDSMYEHETIRVDDLPSEPRWLELARRIPELGVASTMCFQLFVASDDLGTLNLLARRPGAFTDESERVGLLFASHAAVAVAQAQKVTHLNTRAGQPGRDRPGQGHPHGALQDHRHAGVRPARPGQHGHQPQSARGCRVPHRHWSPGHRPLTRNATRCAADGSARASGQGP